MADQETPSADAPMTSIAWDWVARLYDTYARVTYDLPFYLREATSGGDVLELMCGTGRVSLPLAQAGIKLTCVDASSEMLAVLKEKLARQTGLLSEVQVIQMDVRQLALPQQFDLVLLPFQSFGEITSPVEQQQALSHIRRYVRDGGRFICTLHNPHVRRTTADGQLRLLGRFPMAEDRATLLLWGLASYDAATQVVEGVQLYEEYDGAGVMQRKRLLDMRFALLARDQFEARAVAAGFRVAAFYGDYDSSSFKEETSPFMIWVLETA